MAAPRGVGDPERLLTLLWAPSTRVGRSGATVASIVEVAIELADSRGLDALTMREVASRVGVGAMTLYGYLPGKAEMLELMVDRVTGDTYRGHPDPASFGSWEEAARHIARRVYEHGRRHPWLGEVVPARPVLGPGVSRTYERELAAFEGVGLSDLEMDHVVTVVRGLAADAARWQVGLDAVRRDSGLSDQQWWDRIGPALEQALAGEALPIATRVGRSVSSAGEPWAAVELGLELLLAGLCGRLQPPADAASVER